MVPPSESALDFDVICLSSIDWDFVWQGQQEVMSRFARRGCRVLYVENTAVREPRSSDLGRILRRLARAADAPIHGQAVPPGISVLSPLALPYPWDPRAAALNRRLVVEPLRRRASQLRTPHVWAFLPTPLVVDAIRACRRSGSKVVYYCVSDFSTVVRDVDRLRRSEDELLQETDVVFVNGHKLWGDLATRHPNVRIFPFGVDRTVFAPRLVRVEPSELKDIPRPRAGFIGGLHPHLALEWIAEAARRLPKVSFVLIGPAQMDVSSLSGLSNVHLLGHRPHSALPSYVAHFDVGLIPYRQNPYTKSVVPTKLFEYISMELAVVSSDLPEVVALGLPGEVVMIARGAAEFADMVRQAVSHSPTQAERASRSTVADRFSWDVEFEAMLREVMTSAGPVRTGM